MIKDIILSNPILWYILYLKDTVASGIFFNLVIGQEINIKRLSMFGIIASLLFLLLRIIFPMSVSFLLITLLLIILGVIFFKFQIIKSTLVVILYQILNVIFEYIVLMFFVQINIPKEIFSTNSKYLILGNIFISMFSVLTIILLYYSKLKIKIEEDIIKKRTIGIVLNVIATLFLISPNFVFFFSSSVEIPRPIIILNTLSLVILFLLCTYNTYRNNELEMKKNELEYQKLYNSTLNELVNGLRTFKHDFANTLNSIGGYIAVNDMPGLKNFFNQLSDDYTSVNNLSIINTSIIRNPSVYGLLLAKLNTAYSKGIRTSVDIATDLNNSSIKIYELCKILGILLDNAIEASCETIEKILNITIKLDNDTNCYLISISNSIKGNVDLSNIYKKGYSSKGENRGLGLWEVKKFTDKYKSLSLKTSVNNNIFKQELFIQSIPLKNVG